MSSLSSVKMKEKPLSNLKNRMMMILNQQNHIQANSLAS